MDLIAIDGAKMERFILKNYHSDFAVGEENTFKVTLPLNEYQRMSNIKFLNVDNTEFGGVINEIEVDTDEKTVSYIGSCWRGILSEKIIVPPANADYYTATGRPYEILQQIIASVGLNALYSVRTFGTESTVTYRFNRYCSVLEGIEAFLKSLGKVLVVSYDNGTIYLSAEDLKVIEDIDNYDCALSVTKGLRPYNHLICLGQGELKDRQVIHLYLDKNGNIGKRQYYTGIDERASVYDYPSVEDAEALEKYGIEHFELLLESEGANASLSNAELNIGHQIQAYEHNTGVALKKKISKKILTLANGRGIVNYEVNA